jgi:hypothetical protein
MFDAIARATSFFNPGYPVRYHLLPFRSSKDPLDGLITFLAHLAQGNPHDKDVITVTGTPFDSSRPYEPRNAVDFITPAFFHSKNEKNQFLCYDFKKMTVVVTHYTIQTHDYPVGGAHLKSWVIEVSKDNEKWTVVDCRKNDGSLNRPSAVAGFDVECPVEARYVRIRQIGLNWKRTWAIVVRAIEFFGALRIPIAES